MALVLSTVIVHDEGIFAPTGLAGRWAESVKTEFVKFAAAEAPLNKRSSKSYANAGFKRGSLKKGISGDVTRVSVRVLHISVASSAPYTKYVLFGTSRIYSASARVPAGEEGAGQFRSLDWEGGSGMYIPPGMGHKALIRRSVRGQAANNFLERAFNETSWFHPSLKSMRFTG
jgi:hypothetical protein